MTPTELRKRGFIALVDALGCVDAVRFLQQYAPGDGDYTQERYQWLDQLTLDDFRTYVQRQDQQESSPRD
jgi:hypothetical protein